MVKNWVIVVFVVFPMVDRFGKRVLKPLIAAQSSGSVYRGPRRDKMK